MRILALLLLAAATAVSQPRSWPTAGWTVSTPEAEGMDSAPLEQAAAFIDQNSAYRHSLVVARNGRLVFERYFHPTGVVRAEDIQSITKSFTSVLLGIAIDEGLVGGVDRKLYEFYPGSFVGGDDPRKLDITLEHCLSMRAGFAPSSDNFQSAANWYDYIIRSPLSSAPGEAWRYNSGLSHLLAGVIAMESKMPTEEFAASRLFAPLGINPAFWARDWQGNVTGGWGLRVTPRDLAKFGLLVARRGEWDERRIVSEKWLYESTRPRVPGNNYGWHWWPSNLAGFPVAAGSGYGGQYVFAVPDLDLVVATTTDPYLPTVPQSNYDDANDLMVRYVLPAVQAAAPRIDPGGVVNAADYSSRLAAGSFASVFGGNLALATSGWDAAMPSYGVLPTGVGGVRVNIGGRSAHPSYVSPGQVNFLIPTDLAPGRYQVEVVTPRTSVRQEVDVAATAPAFFAFARDGRRLASLSTLRPGDEVAFWASGLGAAVPALAAGAVLDAPRPLAVPPEVTVGGKRATIVYAGLAYAGVWQVNVRVPDGVAPGYAAVELRTGNAVSSEEVVVRVE